MFLLSLAMPSLAAPPADPHAHTVPPKVASDSRRRHNNYFPRQEILDLQTYAYATAERPAGLSYDVYSAIGYGLATSMMVVGPETDAAGNRRVVIIDALEDMGTAKDAATDLLVLYNQKYGKSLTKLPLDAVIYTHNHIDHTGGILGYLEMADKAACPAADPSLPGLDGSYDARRSCVEILAHEKVTDAVINTATVSGRIIQARSLYMYGMLLDNVHPESEPTTPLPVGQAVTNGIGPFLSRGMSSFRIPSRTMSNELRVSVAGLNMKLVYAPSETNDEIVAFLPDALNGADATSTGSDWGGSGLLFSAEVIQGPSFPNLYSLRGTQFRSPATWFESVDKLRAMDAWCMVPSHGPPVCQRKNIDILLKNFRVVEVQPWSGTKAGFLSSTTVAVEMSEATLDAIITGPAQALAANPNDPSGQAPKIQEDIAKAVAAGKVKLLEGTQADADAFFAFFDPFPTCQPALSVPRP
jgi:glyoxylase-like metal-dependent hydrolase (beta-lactamase superfamily II)